MIPRMHLLYVPFLVNTFFTTAAAWPAELEARQAGVIGCITYLHQLQEIVFGQPIALTTSIISDTTFTGPYGYSITVTNAPTLLTTTYTAFSTTTSTADVQAQNEQENPSLPGASNVLFTLPTWSIGIPTSGLPTEPIVIPPFGLPTGSGAATTGRSSSEAGGSSAPSSSAHSVSSSAPSLVTSSAVSPTVLSPSPSSTATGDGFNVLELNLGLSLASSACGVEGSSPDGSCLETLPFACRSLSTATLLGGLLRRVDLRACQTALGILGTANAAACFTSDLVGSLTSINVLNCIHCHVPMCRSCLPDLPTVCASLNVGLLSLTPVQIALCQSALGLFGTGIAQPCFLNAQASLLGTNLVSCLQANIPICPTSVVQTPASLLSDIVVTGCDGQPTPTSCVTALPAACQPSTSGLLGSVVGLLNPLLCQASLGALGVLNAASCFVGDLLSTLTGSDLTLCLTNHLPMCDNCISALPSACQPGSGLTGALCQVALGVYGISTAVTCFAGGVLEALVNDDLTNCLNSLVPYCAPPLATVTRIGGSVAYTSTVTSTENLLGLLDGPVTTFVLVNQPASSTVLSTLTQTSGSVAYTSTVTSTENLLGLVGFSTTTYVVVNVPTTPAVLSTSTQTSGSVNFTSTVTSTENLLGLLNGATTTYVLVNQAAPGQSTPPLLLSTSTQTSGSSAFTTTITSTAGGLLGILPTITTYVLVNRPTLSTSTTTFLGSSGYTSTLTSSTLDSLGIEVGFTFVLVGAATTLPTSTISSGTAAATYTETIGIGLSAIVYVVIPTTPPVLSTSYTTFIGSTGYTNAVTSTIPGLLGLLPLTKTYVLIGVPTAIPTTTITSGSAPQYTTTVGAGILATVQIVIPTPPPVLSTSTTTFIGSAGYTNTVTSTIPGLLGLLPTTTTFVLVGIPTTLPTTTITSGTAPEYTATVGFDLAAVVQVIVPVPSPAIPTSYTTFIGPSAAAFTSTATFLIPGFLGLLPTTTIYVLIGVPIALPTSTITSGASAFTTTSGLGLTARVEVVVPSPLSTTTRTSGSVRVTSTSTSYTVVGGIAGIGGVASAVSTVVVLIVPTGG